MWITPLRCASYEERSTTRTSMPSRVPSTRVPVSPTASTARSIGNGLPSRPSPYSPREQADLIEHIDFGYRAHDGARELLSDGVAHGVMRSRYCGVPCQARIDWLNPKRGIVAVMVCDRFRWRDSHLRDNGLVHELAFHRALLAQIAGRRVPVHVIARRKTDCHIAAVSGPSVNGYLRRAQKDNEKALTRLQECRWLNRWPTGYERVRNLAPIGI